VERSGKEWKGVDGMEFMVRIYGIYASDLVRSDGIRAILPFLSQKA